MTVVPFPTAASASQRNAIVMDGNQRWAAERRMPTAIAVGHASSTGDKRISRLLAANGGYRQGTRQAMQPRMQDHPSETETGLSGDDQRRDPRFGGTNSRQVVH